MSHMPARDLFATISPLRPLWRRGLAAIGLALSLGGAAAAACTGESLRDRLSPAQEQTLAAAIAATPYAEGLIFRAERDGQVVTLMGTLHVHDARIDALAARALPHLQDAGLALFEMTPEDEGRLAQAILSDPALIRLPAGQDLARMLPPATWAEVSGLLQERGLPPAMASGMQPWFLANLVAIPTCALGAAQAGQTGVDHALMAAAEDNAIPMAALEPWDSVLTIFDAMTFDDQVDFLQLSLVAPEVQDALFVAMTDGYFAGRIAEIWEMNTIALDFMPGVDADSGIDMLLQNKMLDARNHAWLPVIEEAAARHGNIFVGAGAAHLPGNEGLLALMAGRGWQITRLE